MTMRKSSFSLLLVLLVSCVPITALTPLPTIEGAIPLEIVTEALDALPSFRYATSGEIISEAGSSTYQVEGVYVHEGRAWRAQTKLSVPGQEAELEIYSTESRLWWAAPGSNDWQAISRWPAFRQIAEDSGPFAYWPNPLEFQPGLPQPQARQIDNLACNDYLFKPVDPSRNVELRLCITPDTSIPLRMEYLAIEKKVQIHVVREFTHIADPGNIVLNPFNG